VYQHLSAMRFVNEGVEHPLGDFEIGDNPVFHRPDCDNVPRRSAHHLFGLSANRLDLPSILVNCDDRRFVYNDAFAFRKHERIRSAQIDGKIGRDQAKNGPKIHEWSV
jgi:hypothetical protein